MAATHDPLSDFDSDEQVDAANAPAETPDDVPTPPEPDIDEDADDAAGNPSDALNEEVTVTADGTSRVSVAGVSADFADGPVTVTEAEARLLTQSPFVSREADA